MRPGNVESSEGSSEEPPSGDGDVCRVCGQTGAQMHYGAVACVGCKGFFRRALKKIDQLECLGNGNCQITKDARTNCRSCRLRACLAAGMKPASVRPDRDFTGKQRKTKKPPARAEPATTERIQNGGDEWNRRLSVEMRTMLMTLLNLELKVSRGDTNQELANLYPLKARTLRELLDDPSILNGKRSEMRYERDRLCRNGELSPIAFRRLIAAIDWVEYLSEMLPERPSVEDRIALVKGCFLPLLVFKVAARTALNTRESDEVLCMCNFSYIPRDVGKLYNDCYHWNNGLVDRVLDDLVHPYRVWGLREEEVVCLSAILAINPLYKDLSEKTSDMVMELRNKIQECLYVVMRETRPGLSAVHFGNLLLTLPTVSTIANEMCENLVFAQTFSSEPSIPLMGNLFGCFPVEPFEEEAATDRVRALSLSHKVHRAVQTDHPLAVRKRRLPETTDSPVEAEPRKMPFSLREAPTDYTLAEMFDDLDEEVAPSGSGFKEGRPRASSQPVSDPCPSSAPPWPLQPVASTSRLHGLEPRVPRDSIHSSQAQQFTYNAYYTMAPQMQPFPAPRRPPLQPHFSYPATTSSRPA